MYLMLSYYALEAGYTYPIWGLTEPYRTEADLAVKEDRAEQSGYHETDNDSQRQLSGGLEI